MRFLAFATDYDGTLAEHGRVAPDVVEALRKVRASGRKLILVTGRELPDLLAVFPDISLFEKVVAENGALLYTPATRETKPLGEKPPSAFIRALGDAGVKPLSVGRVIIATWQPHEKTVLEIIKKMGLELTVSFNKGAVMVLPSGVNKGTGLKSALDELGLSSHNVLGVGDGENDHAFLKSCEYAVAVSNALPMLKQQADWVLNKEDGKGVIELLHQLLKDDLGTPAPQPRRRDLPIGTRIDNHPVWISAYQSNILVVGPSGSGKSTFTQGFLERLTEQGYQYCLLDPEGDYENLAGAVTLGGPQRDPPMEEVLQLLEKPSQNAVITLIGLQPLDRPTYLARLMPLLLDLRLRTGRPHWIVIDEAHHMLPAKWSPATLAFPQNMQGLLQITVHPEHVSPAALAAVNTLVAFGESPYATVESFCRTIQHPLPSLPPDHLAQGQALGWFLREPDSPFIFHPVPGKLDHQRHRRKYAQGQLGLDNSFYFRGPSGKLNLRAQNLETFLQLAEGVDEETWLFHLKNGDYTLWFKDVIKDESLAREVAKIAASTVPSPETFRRVKEAVQRRYAPSA
jgi:phosphoglycolate phosphatase (TIGR01487 family)